MMNSVSTWRCKCGVRIKVVAEAHENKPAATQTAVCPSCGDEQAVYGEKIISITAEKDAPVKE